VTGELTLASGRTIWLEELRQWDVYADLLEGLPSNRLNARIVDSAIESAPSPSVLVRPTERPEPKFPGAGWLPRICSVGTFESKIARDVSCHASKLTIVWFQDDFGFPPTGQALEQVVTVNWNRHATDFLY